MQKRSKFVDEITEIELGDDKQFFLTHSGKRLMRLRSRTSHGFKSNNFCFVFGESAFRKKSVFFYEENLIFPGKLL